MLQFLKAPQEAGVRSEQSPTHSQVGGVNSSMCACSTSGFIFAVMKQMGDIRDYLSNVVAPYVHVVLQSLKSWSVMKYIQGMHLLS